MFVHQILLNYDIDFPTDTKTTLFQVMVCPLLCVKLLPKSVVIELTDACTPHQASVC